MKARSAKAKGSKLEKWTADELNKIGWKARKQPGSGRFAGFEHDVFAEHPICGEFIIECKSHKSPLKTLRNWLGSGEILVHKANFEEPWVTMTFATFAALTSYNEDDDE